MARSYGANAVVSYAAAGNRPMPRASSPRDPAGMSSEIPARPGHAALRRGRHALPRHLYHVTTVTRERSPLFRCPSAARAAARCFHDRDILVGATMLAWVLMPDHVHWLLQLGDRADLAAVVNRLKSASAREANACLERRGPLWRRAYHDHALRRDEDLQAVAAYIIANPVRAGLVERAEAYPYHYTTWP